MNPIPIDLAKRILLSCLISLACANSGLAYKWDEISPEELESTFCRSDPDAAAEILYMEMDIDQAITPDRGERYKFRVKLYKERGVEAFRNFSRRYSYPYSISTVRGRVLKPDGAIYELDKGDIYKDVVEKSNSDKVRELRLSMPNVQVGDIIEIEYGMQMADGYYKTSLFVPVQSEWPVRQLDLAIRPYSPNGHFKWFSKGISKDIKSSMDGFYKMTLNDVPAYPEEVAQAPDLDGRSWFMFFIPDGTSEGDKFWMAFSKELFRKYASLTKPDSDIKAKAKEIVGNRTNKEEQIKALYNFCRVEIVNANRGPKNLVDADKRKKMDAEDPARKVLKREYGSPQNINVLFCALARAIGFDARIVAVTDRSKSRFFKQLENKWMSLPHRIVAIKTGKDRWTFCNPGDKYHPFGKISWIHEAGTALVPDSRKLLFVETPFSEASDNRTIYNGNFQLETDGTIAGTFTATLTGANSMSFRRRIDSRSEQEQVEYVESTIRKMWKNAEMEATKVSDPNDPLTPVTFSMQVRIPNFASVVGNRIFLQPNLFFEEKRERNFTDSTRHTDLFFKFRYNESSHIEIAFPEGYELEAPTAPKPFEIATLVNYQPSIGIKKKSNVIIYKRELDFSGLYYRPVAYTIVKDAFDELKRQDLHTLTLKAASNFGESN